MVSCKMKPCPVENEINVLLMGESGVGKSTFINSFVNYLKFEDFRSALKEDPILLMPIIATVTDNDGNSITIKEGVTDQNEVRETGLSATQDVISYAVPIPKKNVIIRLIDTPGMGDSRGLDVDNENCDHIFNYLAQLKELHAICFLMKPNNTRNTIYFEYCLKQILSRLDISACQNIIFVFTNTRGTDFTPGDTLPCLKKTVGELEANNPNVKIPVNQRQNIFCLDNEPIKAWMAFKQEIVMTKRFMNGCADSWETSSKACKKLFAYITGESKHYPLKPHQLRNTTSINEARRLILQLSLPTAEISQLIDDNLRLLTKHKISLNKENQTVSELKEKLYIPTVRFEVEYLDHPMTVCASSSCMELVVANGVNNWLYKEICCKKCYMLIPKEQLGSTLLWTCGAFNLKGQCKKCNCGMSLHQRIFYLTKAVNENIVDKTVEIDLNNKETVRQKIEKLVKEMDQRKKELEEELRIITESTAQFTLFLENNAIVPYNDAYRRYIKLLIEREKSLGSKKADEDRIYNLQAILETYDEIKSDYVTKRDKTLPPITAEEINEIINKLYSLKHNGKKIEELCQKKHKLHKTEFEKKNIHVSVDITNPIFSAIFWGPKVCT